MKHFVKLALLLVIFLGIGGCAATRERPKNPLSWNAHRKAL